MNFPPTRIPSSTEESWHIYKQEEIKRGKRKKEGRERERRGRLLLPAYFTKTSTKSCKFKPSNYYDAYNYSTTLVKLHHTAIIWNDKRAGPERKYWNSSNQLILQYFYYRVTNDLAGLNVHILGLQYSRSENELRKVWWVLRLLKIPSK